MTLPCLCSIQPFLRCIALDLDLFVVIQHCSYCLFAECLRALQVGRESCI